MNSVHAPGIGSFAIMLVEVLDLKFSKRPSLPPNRPRTIKLPSLCKPGQWWPRIAGISDRNGQECPRSDLPLKPSYAPVRNQAGELGEFLPRPELTILLCAEIDTS